MSDATPSDAERADLLARLTTTDKAISHAECKAVARWIAALEVQVDQVRALINDSDGVYGLHLNGDPAPWEELLHAEGMAGGLRVSEQEPTAERRCPHHADDPRELWRLNCPACWDGTLRAAVQAERERCIAVTMELQGHWTEIENAAAQDIANRLDAARAIEKETT